MKTNLACTSLASLLILGGLQAQSAILVDPSKIQGTPTFEVQGDLLIIDVPFSNELGGNNSAVQGPDWSEDSDDGFTLTGGSTFSEGSRPGWEPDGTLVSAHRTGSFVSAASGNTATYTFDIPNGSVIYNVWGTWYNQGNSGSGHAYSYDELTSDTFVRPAANSSNHLQLQWTASDSSLINSNFQQIFASDITVTGGDGFELTFTAQSGFANIDAIVIDYLTPASAAAPEPSTTAFLAVGLAFIAGFRKRDED